MVKNLGEQDKVLMKNFIFFGFTKEHLFRQDRMLQDFDFPIAFCYGTRDFYGSDKGAD